MICPTPVLPQVVEKTPMFSVFSGDSTQKGEVSFEEWAFKVRSVMQSHTKATIGEGIAHLLWGAGAHVWHHCII